ncbi:hypothetical protein [Flaviaesturariibacter aridisoli]|uniref:DUF3575 domain-containing protein n=1 Tax=Flaviaesturariibacter aridisoli TaxID=2545761 RepID=A0A4R4E209_9BACT|nr:hypothetical protein [Flaviaesturariibacter aridisoli]TCZ72783.1 hypothetical protein E0486_08355 [Flaviaesturariibacter aridisoli]
MQKLLLFLLLLCAGTASAQSGASQSIGLLTGAGVSRYPYVELGLSKNSMAYGGRHAVSAAWYFSSELHVAGKPVLGPKIGGWVAVLPFALGLNGIAYTDFGATCWVLQPEAGLGFDRLKLTYAMNIRLSKEPFDRIAPHALGLAWCFRLKKLEERHGN